jgi:hypothetical protein
MSDGSHDGSWKEDSLGFLSASADAVEGCLPTQSTAQIALLLLGMWTMMKGMLSAYMVHWLLRRDHQRVWCVRLATRRLAVEARRRCAAAGAAAA